MSYHICWPLGVFSDVKRTTCEVEGNHPVWNEVKHIRESPDETVTSPAVRLGPDWLCSEVWRGDRGLTSLPMAGASCPVSRLYAEKSVWGLRATATTAAQSSWPSFLTLGWIRLVQPAILMFPETGLPLQDPPSSHPSLSHHLIPKPLNH